jgi:molybdate transport system substrate-binding protein
MLRTSHSSARALAAAVLVSGGLLALSGCVPYPLMQSTPDPSSARLTGTLTVYAAASLTAPFEELMGEFASDHDGLTVHSLVSDGSPTLATQISQGAPADVFASADEATMASLSDFQVGAPSVFATNTLEIAVRPGNPRHISNLKDLADPALQVVLCAPKVPCGAAAHKLLNLHNVTVAPVSEEQNVTAVLTKVALGEADAGLVYATDVQASAGSVTGVTIADASSATNRYPIATMTTGANPRAAEAFVEFVLSARGQAVLAQYGFGAP